MAKYKRKRAPALQLSEDQRAAYAAVDDMAPGDKLFLTGRAGTGKSMLVEKFCRERAGVVKLASTGLAAQNIGGRTLHSFLGMRPGPLDQPLNPRYLQSQVQGATTIMVDEVSMVCAELFEKAVEALVQASKGCLSFLFVGDFAQLPPVEGTMCCFSDLWRDEVKSLELTKVHRQNDPGFLEALNDIRVGEVRTDRVKALLSDRGCEEFDDSALLLTPKRSIAQGFNDDRLSEIKTKKFKSKAGLLYGNKWIDNKIPEVLLYAEGCRVLMLTNDKEGRWFNGSQGMITYAESDEVRILMDSGGEYYVSPCEHELLTGSGNRKLLFKQFPFQLGYAITIHKSQGMTLNNVAVDMEGHFGGYAMTYVALSRCATREGLHLLGRYL